jgi:hypothetical protein
MTSPSHSAVHAEVAAAIEALEARVGVTGSAVTSSLDYRIAQLEAGFVTKTSDYTATLADRIILCNATGGAFTITLPAAASSSGKSYFIKKIDDSDNFVSVRGNASEPIDDSNLRVLPVQNNSVHVVSDGVQWYVL